MNEQSTTDVAVAELKPETLAHEPDVDEGLVAEQPEINVPEEREMEEIVGLQTAIEKVLAKIKYHEDQIGDYAEDIRGHEDQIADLREALLKAVGPLLGQSLVHRQDQDDSHATGKLIRECLRKNSKPMSTKDIKNFLVKNGNGTNPSVELSRMVKRKQIERTGRGLYQLKK